MSTQLRLAVDRPIVSLAEPLLTAQEAATLLRSVGRGSTMRFGKVISLRASREARPLSAIGSRALGRRTSANSDVSMQDQRHLLAAGTRRVGTPPTAPRRRRIAPLATHEVTATPHRGTALRPNDHRNGHLRARDAHYCGHATRARRQGDQRSSPSSLASRSWGRRHPVSSSCRAIDARRRYNPGKRNGSDDS